jgi:NitT/TauT family transport system substrate-binding protein
LRTTRIAIPDLVSNSYFPAIAAVSLDFFKREGLDVAQELIFPNYKAYEALRDNKVDFVAAPAHVAVAAFPQWRGCKLLMALSQGMFWLLVLRADIAATPGDVSSVKGRAIGAAPMVELGLKQLLIDAGVDLGAVRIVGVPGADAPGVSFGVAAARALADGAIDGFWANAMGAENAVRQGVGKVILDVRRGIGSSVPLYDAGSSHEQCPPRTRPRADRWWHARRVGGAARAQGRRAARYHGGPCLVSACRSRPDRRRGGARPPVL